MNPVTYFRKIDSLQKKHLKVAFFGCSFRFCPIYLPPSPSTQFGQLVQPFSDVKIQDLKVTLELKILDIYNLKKETPFIDQKCTYEKAPKIWAGPFRPPHLDKIQKKGSFSSGDLSLDYYHSEHLRY